MDDKEKLARAEKIINEIWDIFYGQNLYVVGWHLNGDHEPMDSFFEENDWILEDKDIPEEVK